ncbi:hypothetical protein [Spirosoma litoris]
MDLQTIGADLFKLSPLIGILAIAVYVLWGKLQKAQSDILDMMRLHNEDRKETQEKLSGVVNQNSLSAVQLAGSVDNLSKSHSDLKNDIATRFSSLEDKVVKSGRAASQRMPAKAA